jgi:hypothetical protein
MPENVRASEKVALVSGSEPREGEEVKRMFADGLRSNAVLTMIAAMCLLGCGRPPEPGHVQDEAMAAGRTAESFPPADEDYFHDMDGGIALTPDEVKGRDMWLVWTGGNDRFWEKMTVASVGNFDLLKTISSNSNLKFSRDNRWIYLGLANEPCFDKATGPDPSRYGLWLDKRRPDCATDPFDNEKKYPGVQIGARGKNLPVGSYYGAPTGVIGLRLFPNPDFDEAAEQKWDPVRYYNDPSYYQSKDLIRPYRVGMSCAFCHVGPNPTKPPADPEKPKWENLSSNVGAQYFWVDRIWTWPASPENYIYQLLHTSRPGTLDTSLVSSDYINNPRSMNAVYALSSRLEIAKRWGKEALAGGGLNNKQFNDYVAEGPLTQFFEKPSTVWTPHVLKDGSDSVGALGALNRVYLNIGVFSEEWLLHFNPLVGGTPITPIEISSAEKNSSYWRATEAQTPDMALFFFKSTAPHYLKDAPGGGTYLTSDKSTLERGKVVFAERCARCHSSKLPTPAPGLDPQGCAGPGYLACWNRYWSWTKTDDFKQKMRQIVLADDFLDNNYLSADFRVPVTLLQTNACSPLATNAIGGNIWDNFSSQSYKDLPSVGTVTVYNPFTGEPRAYQMPAGGRGYTRPASLISAWSTAPFLQNNSVGKFNPSPSVDARMKSFQDSIEQMLWPERRDKDPVLGNKIPGVIDRTTAQSYLWVAAGYLPDFLHNLQGPLERFFPSVFGDGGVKIGPIPKGTPVDLLANLELISEAPEPATRAEHQLEVAGLVLDIKGALEKLPKGATDEQARQAFAPLVGKLLALSKCPDFVVNRGHYFGSDQFTEEPGLSDADKRALIEYIKNF